MRTFRFLLLAFLILGGQQALLHHATGHMDAVHPDHACELCLHAGAFDNGIAPSTIPFVSPLLDEAPLAEYQGFEGAHSARLFDARGPPVYCSA